MHFRAENLSYIFNSLLLKILVQEIVNKHMPVKSMASPVCHLRFLETHLLTHDEVYELLFNSG